MTSIAAPHSARPHPPARFTIEGCSYRADTTFVKRMNRRRATSVGWAKRKRAHVFQCSPGEMVGTARRAFAHPTRLQSLLLRRDLPWRGRRADEIGGELGVAGLGVRDRLLLDR